MEKKHKKKTTAQNGGLICSMNKLCDKNSTYKLIPKNHMKKKKNSQSVWAIISQLKSDSI